MRNMEYGMRHLFTFILGVVKFSLLVLVLNSLLTLFPSSLSNTIPLLQSRVRKRTSTFALDALEIVHMPTTSEVKRHKVCGLARAGLSGIFGIVCLVDL